MNARRPVLAALCTVTGALVFASVPALALKTQVFSTSVSGSGASVLADPRDVAIDQSTDHALFTPAPPANGHVFSGSFGPGGTGTSFVDGGPGESSSIQSIAVDESTGDVYVYNAGGALFKFNSSGEPVDFSSTGTNSINVGGFGGGENEVAVDNSSGPDKGDFYVADGGAFENGVTVFESNGTEVDELNGGVESLGAPWGEVCGVAVDPEGDVYLAFSNFINGGRVAVNHVNKYTPAGPAGTPLGNSDYTSSLTNTGQNHGCNIAADAKGDVYLDAHPQGPVVEYHASQFGESQAVGTTFDERGNSIAVESGGNHEVYIDEGSDVAQFGGTGGLLAKFAGSGPGAIKNSLGVAVNASTREVYVADEEEPTDGKVNIFSAAPVGPPTVQASVADVASTSATLQAQIDPNGRDTHAYIQYGAADCTTSPSLCTDVPAAPGQDVGSGEFDQTVSIHVQDLLAGTVYHFRVVAVNALNETTDGPPDQTFTTQPGGGELVLPDGRQWELVSPADKNGSRIEPFAEGGVIEASAEGSAITYMASAPVGVNPPTNNNEAQLFSARGSGGWSTQDISPPHSAPVGEIIGSGQEYRFFSEDLSLGALEQRGEIPLPPEATERTVYLRHAATGALQPLVTGANVPQGTEFGGNQKAYGDISLITGTPDLSHVIINSKVPLTPNATEGGFFEWAGGQLQLVTVLPNGVSASNSGNGSGTELGSSERLLRHTISNDGSRVIWSAEGQAAPFAGHHMYLRDMSKGETVQVDANQGDSGSTEEGEPKFQTANSEGSKVFFTDGARLTANSTGGRDLYVFEVTSTGEEPLAGKLTDLTADTHTGEGPGVQGVLPGASEDGSYVYVVAEGVLSDTENAQKESASPGGRNLYVLHDTGGEWTTTFIATLSSDDESDWGSSNLTELGTSRVSPDGLYLAFMSDRSLTGYDNTDANSGEPDEEVFLYDASSNRVVCASCNPSGARPTGVFDPGGLEGSLLVDTNHVLSRRWLAASIPGWTAVELGEALYQSRYLSDSGRLFFDSPDALVPQDTDGKENVYEYEPEGIESCERSDITFSEKSGGCVGLISAGTSGEESAFLDASTNGDDVFFLTTSKLVSQDSDSAFDVYDAHVCGASAPCSEAPVAPPACTTADACKPAPAAQPAIFGPPPSGTFSGAGNVVGSTPVSSAPSKKSLTRAQKLAKALKVCRQKRKQRPRALCEAGARKLYGAKSAAKRLRNSKKGRR
jgi:WD40-like Beta Propeller Repeat